ncbi:hypothetical protein FB45DRAFT_899722 [Roridomyces roridus]|uniref:Uncharacterized protein n=1 Tax=Roridomyces roridus TaxID=1738132 RepID=A0AAD7FW18_9AGAR|nr:hypothetical protein FB45DRAFT_899722 [Roridomyces roridus]
MDKLESWVGRSGFCPLSIQMKRSARSTELISWIVDTIVIHRNRCEALTLILPDSLISYIEGPMPMLRHLSLRFDDIDTDYIPVSYSISDLPLLRVVSLSNFDIPRDFLPWAQLTSLTLNPTAPSECIPIILEAVGLTYLELTIASDDDCPPDALLHLPLLESLIVVQPDPEAQTWPLPDFLGSFIVPRLRYFQVREAFLGEPAVYAAAVVAALIGVSGPSCRVQKLVVTGRTCLSQASLRKGLDVISRVAEIALYKEIAVWRQGGDEDDEDDEDDSESE